MRIGYLLAGPPLDGIRLHAEGLAAAAAADGHEVLAVPVPGRGLADLTNAADELSTADVIHAQVAARSSSSLWGPPPRAGTAIATFAARAGTPLVFTVHDLGPGLASEPAGAVGWLKQATRAWERKVLAAVDDAASALIVSSAEEQRRLAERLPARKGGVRAIPLPVPHADVPPAAPPGDPTITLLGFIHSRKGHSLAVEALPGFADRARLVFAGGTTGPWRWFARRLTRRAEQLGVGDRLTITGPLDRTALERRLAATTLAICPFRDMAASGSLATWIGTGRPVLASALPQVDELNRLVPGSIEVFAPYTPEALAKRIHHLLEQPPPAAPRRQLAAELSPERVFARHETVYREVVGS
jgi:glycosyltransferase involved in cell wall biosynthesis